MLTTTELIMLGTGNAAATRCYNTCFAIRHGKQLLLVDGGGGNGILTQLEKAGIALSDIHHVFITHTHTDHLLGVIWILRMAAQAMQKGTYAGQLHLYGHDRAIMVLQWICQHTLPPKIVAQIGRGILLHTLNDGEQLAPAGMDMQCFDIGSTKEKQFGFRLTLPEGKTLVCLGDEPFNPTCRKYVAGVDWMLCEAFCLYADRDLFKPYEKHHSTALDAARTAAELQVGNLVLYHTEDQTLTTRKSHYTTEAQQEFSGTVWVPDDLDVIPLEQHE